LGLASFKVIGNGTIQKLGYGFRRNFVKIFDADKNSMIALPCGEKNYEDMLSRFHLIPER